MEIIFKEQIYNYRHGVAKVAFLIAEKQYELKLDIEDSNLMLVHDKKNEKDIYISILGKPNKTTLDISTIKVFYQREKYRRYKSIARGKEGVKLDTVELSREFDSIFNELLDYAFTNPSMLFEKLEYLGIKSEKEYNLVRYYFFHGKKNNEEFAVNMLYKYFSKETVEKNNYNIKDGKISFVHPKCFNDPFDCNCLLANGISMMDKFRVLCLTNDYKNILMWSYYGQNHSGYSFQYMYSDLIKVINKINLNGLCIYGEVDYKSKRPPQKSSQSIFSFTNLKFYIDAIFTKYEEWKHEKEHRFVIISSSNIDPFIEIKADIIRVYNGCLGDGKDIYDSNGNKLPSTIKLLKDSCEYKLKV